MDCDLDACYKTALDVTKKAAVLIREAYSAEKRVQLKSSSADLVTETDQAVEKLIISHLKSQFPTHSFIGEESVAAGEKCVWTDNPTWMIDPIDGTTNFVHRFPYTCISIGLTVNKKTEIGIIYNPILEQMYTARAGQGAFCNGERLKVTTVKDIGQALVCAEFGSDRDPKKMEAKIASKKRVVEKSHGSRELGSAALEMAFVAAGHLDGKVHQGIHCWDYAAGELLVTEAGGVVLDTSGSCALNMCAIAAGQAEAYYENGVHCWDMAAGDLVLREAGGVVIDVAGGPLDLMSRRMLCACTKELAEQLVGLVEPIEYERD